MARGLVKEWPECKLASGSEQREPPGTDNKLKCKSQERMQERAQARAGKKAKNDFANNKG